MQERANARLTLFSELRRAVRQKEFTLVYQPIVDLKTRKVVCHEALLRWTREDGETPAPVCFITELEEAGLILPVGGWVLEEVCRELARCPGSTGTARCSVNVSVRQFHNGDMHEVIERALSRTGLEPGRLTIEITESILLDAHESNLRQLRAIRALGVKIYLDDFGTGYSSLSYLKRFPVDALKIDQSFVRDVSDNTDDATLVRTIIAMAHNLGIEVVAEGVETETQLAFLSACQCDYAQGYYLGEAGQLLHTAMVDESRYSSVG
jgi:EAL domain-containing protein (putative c-di-GMP-specific phosphodiesterase class I)